MGVVLENGGPGLSRCISGFENGGYSIARLVYQRLRTMVVQLWFELRHIGKVVPGTLGKQTAMSFGSFGTTFF